MCFSAGKLHFAAICSGGLRIMSGSLFLDEIGGVHGGRWVPESPEIEKFQSRPPGLKFSNDCRFDRGLTCSIAPNFVPQEGPAKETPGLKCSIETEILYWNCKFQTRIEISDRDKYFGCWPGWGFRGSHKCCFPRSFWVENMEFSTLFITSTWFVPHEGSKTQRILFGTNLREIFTTIGDLDFPLQKKDIRDNLFAQFWVCPEDFARRKIRGKKSFEKNIGVCPKGWKFLGEGWVGKALEERGEGVGWDFGVAYHWGQHHSERFKHAPSRLSPPISRWGKTVDSYRRSCRNSKTSHRKGGGGRGRFPAPEGSNLWKLRASVTHLPVFLHLGSAYISGHLAIHGSRKRNSSITAMTSWHHNRNHEGKHQERIPQKKDDFDLCIPQRPPLLLHLLSRMVTW